MASKAELNLCALYRVLVLTVDESSREADTLRLVYAHTRSLRDLISAEQNILPGNRDQMLKTIETIQARLDSLLEDDLSDF